MSKHLGIYVKTGADDGEAYVHLNTNEREPTLTIIGVGRPLVLILTALDARRLGEALLAAVGPS